MMSSEIRDSSASAEVLDRSSHPRLWFVAAVFVVSLLVCLFGPDEGMMKVLSRSAALVSSAAFVAELFVVRLIARYGDDGHDDAV